MKVKGDIFKIMYMYEWYSTKLRINEEIVEVPVAKFVAMVEVGIKPIYCETLPYEVGEDYTGISDGQDIANPLDKNLFNVLRRLNHLGTGKTLRLAVSKPLAQKLRAEGIIQ